MKYLKTFELHSMPITNPIGNFLDYEVGDVVVCADKEDLKNNFKATNKLEVGKKYKVLNLYQTPEDKFLKNPYLRVDVEDLETGEITKGWSSKRFKVEMEFDAGKYNIF